METNVRIKQQSATIRPVERELNSDEKKRLKYQTGENSSFPSEIGAVLVFANTTEAKIYGGMTYAAFPCYLYSANGDFQRVFYFPAGGLDKLDYPDRKKENGQKRCTNREAYPFDSLNLAQSMTERGLCLKVTNVVSGRFVPTWDSEKSAYIFKGDEKETDRPRVEIVPLPAFAVEQPQQPQPQEQA